MSGDTLDKIVADKRRHVAGRISQRPLRMVEALARDNDSPRGFAKALKATIAAGRYGLIAEIKKVLAGEKNAFRDIVILNSAAALMVAGKAKELKEGAALAAQSIDGGKAANALETLQRICA